MFSPNLAQVQSLSTPRIFYVISQSHTPTNILRYISISHFHVYIINTYNKVMEQNHLKRILKNQIIDI